MEQPEARAHDSGHDRRCGDLRISSMGIGTEQTLWLFQQGRKYVEAPRWAAIGVATVMLVFAWNVVGTAIKAKRITRIMAVLSINMVPLVLLYLPAFPAISNMAVDL